LIRQTLETFGGQSSIVQDSWDTVLAKYSDLEVKGGMGDALNVGRGGGRGGESDGGASV
jgi:hypothetical protein